MFFIDIQSVKIYENKPADVLPQNKQAEGATFEIKLHQFVISRIIICIWNSVHTNAKNTSSAWWWAFPFS